MQRIARPISLARIEPESIRPVRKGFVPTKEPFAHKRQKMTSGKSPQIRFISPVGCVGGGISGAAFDEALARAPHFIACDAGTTDAGPFSLGMGIPAFPREAVKRDLSLMLRAGRNANIPVIIGSAGTAGGDVHVDWVLEIAREIVAEHHLTLRTAVI